jgi:hypothetical protein
MPKISKISMVILTGFRCPLEVIYEINSGWQLLCPYRLDEREREISFLELTTIEDFIATHAFKNLRLLELLNAEFVGFLLFDT